MLTAQRNAKISSPSFYSTVDSHSTHQEDYNLKKNNNNNNRRETGPFVQPNCLLYLDFHVRYLFWHAGSKGGGKHLWTPYDILHHSITVQSTEVQL